jgi:hypothetical protein
MSMNSTTGEYSPELIAIMADALKVAWGRLEGAVSDAELARLVMASAIIEQVDAGIRLREELVTRATSALTAAVGLSRGDVQTRWY